MCGDAMRLKARLKRIWHFLQRENFVRLLGLILAFMLLSALGIVLLEPKMTLSNGLWWSIVTMTTVGYGDISPSTLGGRIVAVATMLFGIGVLGLFSATIASVLVDKKIKEDRGMNTYHLKNHIILCEWNHRARTILNEFRADSKTADSPIVLIAGIDQKPVNDDKLFFVQGQVNDETLGRANLAQASTVVILGDDHLDATARDAKVVLGALTVESINPDVYTIVELANVTNVKHCERAHADEIVVTSDLGSGLIARAALDHGITQVVSDLLSSHHGEELYKLAIPASMIGRRFIEVMTEMKQRHASIVLAVQKGSEGQVTCNPPSDYLLEKDDHVFVVAAERPELA
jgi:voltage-gated potassium channel